MNQFKDKEMIKPFINCFRRFFGKIRHYESGINYIEKAFQCGNNQDYVGAFNYVNQFIDINPDNAEAYYIRGLSRVMLYEFDESLNDFSKAISLKKKIS